VSPTIWSKALWQGLADNSIGKTMDALTRNNLIIGQLVFTPSIDTAAQLLFRFVAPPTNTARSRSDCTAPLSACSRELSQVTPEDERVRHDSVIRCAGGDSGRSVL
jgi:hypothetical protein